jgi:hypothetical protein
VSDMQIPDDGHQWVEVKFYAQVPRGQRMLALDVLETARTLTQSFGFTAIAGLTVTTGKPAVPYTETASPRPGDSSVRIPFAVDYLSGDP